MDLIVAFYRWQREGKMHPWTCGAHGCREDLSIISPRGEYFLICPVCETLQPLTENQQDMIRRYAEMESNCDYCGKELGTAEAHPDCQRRASEGRCVRCGNWPSICGHALSFTERIQTVQVNRESLK